jgi:hypothetical protein
MDMDNEDLKKYNEKYPNRILTKNNFHTVVKDIFKLFPNFTEEEHCTFLHKKIEEDYHKNIITKEDATILHLMITTQVYDMYELYKVQHCTYCLIF